MDSVTFQRMHASVILGLRCMVSDLPLSELPRWVQSLGSRPCRMSGGRSEFVMLRCRASKEQRDAIGVKSAAHKVCNTCPHLHRLRNVLSRVCMLQAVVCKQGQYQTGRM